MCWGLRSRLVLFSLNEICTEVIVLCESFRVLEWIFEVS